MEVKKLSISDITANTYNPNKLTSQGFDDLKEKLDTLGFRGTICVWDRPTTFQIIDGEHRWRAAKQLDQPELQAEILTNEDLAAIAFELKKINLIDKVPKADDEAGLETVAQVLTWMLNKRFGDNEPELAAKMLKNLEKNFTAEQIGKTLSMRPEELRAYQSLLKMDKKELKQAKTILNAKHETFDLKLHLTKYQFEIIQAAVEHSKKAQKPDAVVEICNFYCRAKGVEVPEPPMEGTND